MQTLTEREKALLQKIIEHKENHMSPYACRNTNAVREHASKYDNDVLRTQFAIDVDSILHSALYNRGNDKTQVFSFYRNDDNQTLRTCTVGITHCAHDRPCASAKLGFDRIDCHWT